jgi:hypothetical protein
MIDGWIAGKGILNTTIIPYENTITPQLGIVYIGILISYFILTTEQILFILSTLSFIAILFSFIVINKIFREFKVERLYRNCILLALCIPINLYNIYLQPLNDTFFILLSSLSIYIIILWNKHRQLKYLIILIVISFIVSLFRIQGSLIFLSALLVTILYKRYYDSIVYLLLSLTTYLSSYLFLNIFHVETVGIKQLTIYTFSEYSSTYFVDKIINTFNNIIPKLIIGDPARIMFVKYAVIIILFYFCRTNIKQLKKTYYNFNYLLILFIIISNILFFQFFVQVERYLLSTLPLILLIIFKFLRKDLRSSVLIIYVIMGFATSIVRTIDTVLFDYSFKQNKYIIDNNHNFLPENYDLISQHPRLTYFLLNKPSVNNIKSDKILIIGYEKNIFKTIEKYISNKDKYELEKLPYTIRRNRYEYYTLNLVSITN